MEIFLWLLLCISTMLEGGAHVRIENRYGNLRNELKVQQANGTTDISSESMEENNDNNCQPEAFPHYYVIGDGLVQIVNNTWRATKVNKRAGLQQMCLRSNGLPVTRKCIWNTNHVVAWEDISHWPDIHCYRDTKEHIITAQLHNIHEQILEGEHLQHGVEGRKEKAKLVAAFIENPNYKLLPADIDYTSKIFSAITAESNDTTLMTDISNAFSKIIASDSKILRLSAELNATNSLLDTFESYMDTLTFELVSQKHCNAQQNKQFIQNDSERQTLNFSHLGVVAQITSEVSVFFVNPNCANISGIAIYENSPRTVDLMQNPLGQFHYRFLYLNESTEDLLKEPGLAAATFLPLSLWTEIRSAPPSKNNKEGHLIVVKIYSSANIFIELKEVQTAKPFSKIISITIPGFKDAFSSDFPFILRNINPEIIVSATSKTGCGYWNYDTWLISDVQTISNFSETNLILCGTKHLTQFGFLVGGNYKQTDLSDEVLISPVSRKALDIISVMGCSLSLIGLLGIWLTAALFPKWRLLASRKVLLHLCLALTLQMILFLFINTDNMAEHLSQNSDFSAICVTLGALMQYLILVLFMWMLSTAYLQFQRYVTVIGDHRPTHYVLKSAILAWGLPVILTLTCALIDPGSYIPTDLQLSTDTGICYPSGNTLIFGIIVPVCIITMINAVIFIYVFYSISHTLKQPTQRTEKNIIHKQIQLSILLFFILGLPWIFGILSFMRASIVFSYLFCLTATLQGFVLFVFYVLMDELARTSWMLLLCPSRTKKIGSKSTELQSMTTTSTNIRSSHQQGNCAVTSPPTS